MSQDTVHAGPELPAALDAALEDWRPVVEERLVELGYSGDGVVDPVLELIRDRVADRFRPQGGSLPSFNQAVREVFDEVSTGDTLDQASMLVAYLDRRYRSSALDAQLRFRFRSRFDRWSVGYTYEAYRIAKDDLRRFVERQPIPAEQFNVAAIVSAFAETAMRKIRGAIIDEWAYTRVPRERRVQISYDSDLVEQAPPAAGEEWTDRVEQNIHLVAMTTHQPAAISEWLCAPNRDALIGWRPTGNALSPADDGNAARIAAAALAFRNLILGLAALPERVVAVLEHLPQRLREEEIFQWAACIIADPNGRFYDPRVAWDELPEDDRSRYRGNKFALWEPARALLRWSLTPEGGRE